MSFASLVFFIFLPVVFALHWICPRRQWQNAVLLAASYFFYGWWDYRYCSLMLFSSLMDYVIGRKLADARTPRQRKFLLAVTLVSNLGLLGVFKYFKFFADSFALAFAALGLDVNTTTLNLVLPVGISFYTFQTLSYTLDIYRGQFAPRKDLLEYLTFVSFFPQLVAGPIERATHLLPQFSVARTFSAAAAITGCRLMLWGLAKKMIVADNLGGIVENIFVRADSATGAELALATFAFAFQIYCDFSGYSDIAAGAASLFGIQLMRNFAFPYFSQSLTEFWRRWHISLSTWFRDYVFIPLGGSRVSRGRTAANILLTMLLSGLWHGAAWHYVAWGALHGACLLMEKFFGCQRVQIQADEAAGGESFFPNWSACWRMARTFLIVNAAWIFFRAENLSEAFQIYDRIGSEILAARFYIGLGKLADEHRTVLITLALLVLAEWCGRRRWNPLAFETLPVVARWLAYSALCWSILYFGTQRSADFIYFQF